MASYELKNQVSANNEVRISGGYSTKDRDNAELARLGKKPVLKVCLQLQKGKNALESILTIASDR